MNIKKLKTSDKDIVLKCDELYKKFLKSEKKYDSNFLERDDIKSFLNDLEDDNKMLYAAIVKKEVVGFLYGYVSKNKNERNKVAHLTFLYVDYDYRKRKIATNLIERFICDMSEKSIINIEVKVYDNNDIAKKLYKKFGFEALWLNLRRCTNNNI